MSSVGLDRVTPPLGLQRVSGVPEMDAGGLMTDVRLWKSPRGVTVMTSVDEGFLHASISRPDRYPTWDEIKQLREWYFPDEMEVVMVLARRSEYINLHANCFHLWQSRCGEEGR